MAASAAQQLMKPVTKQLQVFHVQPIIIRAAVLAHLVQVYPLQIPAAIQKTVPGVHAPDPNLEHVIAQQVPQVLLRQAPAAVRVIVAIGRTAVGLILVQRAIITHLVIHVQQ